MAALQEGEVWESGIYQIETTDPIIGGANGVSNLPQQQLANRTVWLKAQLLIMGIDWTDLAGRVSALEASQIVQNTQINQLFTLNQVQQDQIDWLIANIGSSGGGGSTPPSVTSSSPANGIQGTAYTAHQFTSSPGGGVWSVSNGTLPAGMNLSSGGLLSGAPTADGSYTFTVQVIVAGIAGSQVVNMTIAPQAPVISTQPQSQAKMSGQVLTLTVTASPATSYQWRKNGANISGANASTYTKTNFQTADAGNYDCVVTYAGQTTTSNVATVSVQVGCWGHLQWDDGVQGTGIVVKIEDLILGTVIASTISDSNGNFVLPFSYPTPMPSQLWLVVHYGSGGQTTARSVPVPPTAPYNPYDDNLLNSNQR